MRKEHRINKKHRIIKEFDNQHGRLDLYFRAHALPDKSQQQYRSEQQVHQPEHALIFHCATTTDQRQDLVCGAYVCARLKNNEYFAKEIGLFHRDGYPEELRVLKRFVKDSTFELGTIEQFRRSIFLKYLKAGARIVAYDAP